MSETGTIGELLAGLRESSSIGIVSSMVRFRGGRSRLTSGGVADVLPRFDAWRGPGVCCARVGRTGLGSGVMLAGEGGSPSSEKVSSPSGMDASDSAVGARVGASPLP